MASMHLPSHPNLHGWCICRWRLVRSQVKLQPFVPCVWTSWRACSHWAKPCEVCKCRSKASFHCSTGLRILENFGQDKHGQTLHGFTMASKSCRMVVIDASVKRSGVTSFPEPRPRTTLSCQQKGREKKNNSAVSFSQRKARSSFDKKMFKKAQALPQVVKGPWWMTNMWPPNAGSQRPEGSAV